MLSLSYCLGGKVINAYQEMWSEASNSHLLKLGLPSEHIALLSPQVESGAVLLFAFYEDNAQERFATTLYRVDDFGGGIRELVWMHTVSEIHMGGYKTVELMQYLAEYLDCVSIRTHVDSVAYAQLLQRGGFQISQLVLKRDVKDYGSRPQQIKQ